MSEQITILVVDDHPLVRAGLKSILEEFPDFSVVDLAKNGEQAVSMSDELKPDVVLLDMNMPGMNSIEALKQIQQRIPETKVLMLTSFTEDLNVQQALDNGAMGYLIKNTEISELVRAIRDAVNGKHTLSPEAIKSLIQNRPRPTPSGHELTKREKDVLFRIVQGLTNQEIGDQLSISASTAKAYAAKIYQKLGVKSRAEAIAKAISLQIVTPE